MLSTKVTAIHSVYKSVQIFQKLVVEKCLGIKSNLMAC